MATAPPQTDLCVAPSRIAVQVKKHRHPTDDAPESRALWLLLDSLPMLLCIAASFLASYRLWFMIGGIAAAAVIIREWRELISTARDFWRTRNPLWAVIVSAMSLCFLILFAPVYLVGKQAGRLQRRLADQRGRALDAATMVDSEFTSRLTCVGEPAELARVLEIQDVPFEPIIVGSTHLSKKKIMLFMLGLAGLVFGGGIIFVALVQRIWGSPTSYLFQPGLWNFAFLLGLPLAVYPVLRGLFPLHYRVVPGRLDIMKFNAWGTRARSIEQVDLRSSTITVDFVVEFIRINPDGDPSRGWFISFEGIPEKHRLGEAVLMGAMSTFTAPSIPHDELLG